MKQVLILMVFIAAILLSPGCQDPATEDPIEPTPPPVSNEPPANTGTPPPMNTSLEKAWAIGKDILFSAKRNGSQVSWTYPPEFNNQQTFYQGDCGVICFLADLYRAKPSSELRETLEDAGRTLQNRQQGLNYSSFSGLSGFAVTYLRLHQALGDVRWLDAAKAIADAMPLEVRYSSDAVDLITGTLGQGLLLLDLFELTGKQIYLNKATTLADNGLRHATPDGAGIKFASSNRAGQVVYYYGMAHGGAAYGYFLSRLITLAQDDAIKRKYRVPALAVADWIMRGKQVSSRQIGWPGLDNSPQGEMANAWCHGAPGIGLFFVQLYRATGNAHWLNEAVSCGEETNKLTCTEACRCHGYSGNAIIFFSLYRETGEERWLEMARKFSQSIWSQRDTSSPWPRWKDGNADRHIRHYGFMVGLSGIGQFYLELHDPQRYAMPITP